ncbi:threonylcarbamoyl-AMP synthase [Candidatus Peregrinibacteria bacterium]|nr:threonylcarbamoyl-AMP synthase [Candidatus Peregrinibacteria bacterium]
MNKVNIEGLDALEKAIETLKTGGIVMHPTETCYGFAADIFNEKALKKLYELKGREFNKPVSILVSSFGMANEYGVFSEKAFEIANKYWPGPLSIVVPRTRNLPDHFNPGEKFVSIRFSSNDFCIGMIEEFGRPVTTTSANIAGNEPLYEVDLSQFGKMSDEINLVVNGGEINSVESSTIVKISGDDVEVLRQGEICV